MSVWYGLQHMCVLTGIFSRGFNVVTLTDCTAATSEEGHKAAVEGTYGMFSTPMSKSDFIEAIST